MSALTMIKANTVQGYTARTEFLQGKQFLVVPVVMLVEGVHSGSAGPVFYPLSELRDLPAAWNGRPVTLGHPPEGAGTPEALQEFMLGTLFNTRFDDEQRLVSEAWLDVELTRQRAPELLEAAQNGKIIEISTGLWFEESGGSGVWNGEEFMTTAINFRPDHLALLPESVGACSVPDGCGVRNETNKKQEVSYMDRFKRLLRNFVDDESKPERVAVMLKELAINKPGMVSIARALQRHADSLDRDALDGRLIHWLEEAFDDGTFIMRQNGPDGQKFFQGTFTVDAENDEVAVGDDFTEVREQRDFVELEATQEVETVSTDKEQLVAALIECDKTHFNESHKEALMAMDDEVLNSLKATDNDTAATEAEEAAAPVEPEEAAAATEEVVTEPAAAAEEVIKPTEMEAYIEAAPEHLKPGLKAAVQANETRRSEIIDNILKAPGCTFERADLEAKDDSELEAMGALIKGVADEKPDAVVNQGEPMGRAVNFGGKVTPDLTKNEDKPMGEPMGRPTSFKKVG